MFTVQTKQHSMGAADFDLPDEKGLFTAGRDFSLFAEPTLQICAERLKCELIVLHPPLTRGEQVIAGHTINPRREAAFAAEVAKGGKDADENLL